MIEPTLNRAPRLDAANGDSPPLAVFDLDGTLVKGDTLIPFLLTYSSQRRRYWPVLTLPFWLGLYVCGIFSDHKTKEMLIKVFLGGQPAVAIGDHARWFAQNWVSRRVRGEVAAKLREHQAAGCRVILLSASPDLYVPAIADFFSISEVVCTRVEMPDGHGRTAILGTNCKGEAKLAALKEYLGQQLPPPCSFAYGDSASDRYVLNWVHNGILV